MRDFSAIAFTGNRIDRQSEKRSDDIVNEMRDRDETRFVSFCGDRVVYAQGIDPASVCLERGMIETSSPRWQDACFLGWEEGVPLIAVPLAIEPEDIAAPLRAIGLRAAYTYGVFPRHQLGALSQAASLLAWHCRNGFCAQCGKPSRMSAGGASRLCDHCGARHFPRTDPVAIMLVHHGDRCLLGRTPHFEAGRYSCLAGFIEQGETLEAAVRRETFEEMGVRVGAVEYIASQPWPFPHSLMFGCHGEAVSGDITIDHDEMEDGRWFTREEVRQMIAGNHPDGLSLPPPDAIAHFLIREWVFG